MSTLQQYIVATRPWSFSMSAISVTLGTLVAWRSGPIHWGAYVAVLVGMVAMHAAGNVLNDYFDSRNSVDQPDSPTVRYRPHPIVGGLMSLRTLVEGVALLAIATVIGLGLAVFRTPWVVWIALAGFLLTFFYTAGPVTVPRPRRGGGVPGLGAADVPRRVRRAAAGARPRGRHRFRPVRRAGGAGALRQQHARYRAGLPVGHPDAGDAARARAGAHRLHRPDACGLCLRRRRGGDWRLLAVDAGLPVGADGRLAGPHVPEGHPRRRGCADGKARHGLRHPLHHRAGGRSSRTVHGIGPLAALAFERAVRL